MRTITIRDAQFDENGLRFKDPVSGEAFAFPWHSVAWVTSQPTVLLAIDHDQQRFRIGGKRVVVKLKKDRVPDAARLWRAAVNDPGREYTVRVDPDRARRNAVVPAFLLAANLALFPIFIVFVTLSGLAELETGNVYGHKVYVTATILAAVAAIVLVLLCVQGFRSAMIVRRGAAISEIDPRGVTATGLEGNTTRYQNHELKWVTVQSGHRALETKAGEYLTLPPQADLRAVQIIKSRVPVEPSQMSWRIAIILSALCVIAVPLVQLWYWYLVPDDPQIRANAWVLSVIALLPLGVAFLSMRERKKAERRISEQQSGGTP